MLWRTHANTYLQVVYFDKEGVKADTLLAHGLDEEAITSGRNNLDVTRYSDKDWLHFPFQEKQVLKDPAMKRLVLHY